MYAMSVHKTNVTNKQFYPWRFCNAKIFILLRLTMTNDDHDLQIKWSIYFYYQTKLSEIGEPAYVCNIYKLFYI